MVCVSVRLESSSADAMSSFLFLVSAGRDDSWSLALDPGSGFVGRSSQLGRLLPDLCLLSHRASRVGLLGVGVWESLTLGLSDCRQAGAPGVDTGTDTHGWPWDPRTP